MNTTSAEVFEAVVGVEPLSPVENLANVLDWLVDELDAIPEADTNQRITRLYLRARALKRVFDEGLERRPKVEVQP